MMLCGVWQDAEALRVRWRVEVAFASEMVGHYTPCRQLSF